MPSSRRERRRAAELAAHDLMPEDIPSNEGQHTVELGGQPVPENAQRRGGPPPPAPRPRYREVGSDPYGQYQARETRRMAREEDSGPRPSMGPPDLRESEPPLPPENWSGREAAFRQAVETGPPSRGGTGFKPVSEPYTLDRQAEGYRHLARQGSAVGEDLTMRAAAFFRGDFATAFQDWDPEDVIAFIQEQERTRSASKARAATSQALTRGPNI